MARRPPTGETREEKRTVVLTGPESEAISNYLRHLQVVERRTVSFSSWSRDLLMAALPEAFRPEEMVELYDIITFLSGQLLSRGIPRYTELTYHRFRTLIEEMEKSKDTDNSVSLLIQFAEAAYAPAGLKYSLELALQILNRNIPIIQGMVEKIYKGKIPTRFQRLFIELCQKKETKKAIEMWTNEFEQLTKGFVAIISDYKP